MANERDYYYSELMTAVSGLTINSNTMNVTNDDSDINNKSNYIHVHLGDEITNWRTDRTSVEDNTQVGFELLAQVKTSSSDDKKSIKNEAITKLRKKLITYRKSTPNRTDTGDFIVVIENLTYEGVFSAVDMKANLIQILITGNLIINLWES